MRLAWLTLLLNLAACVFEPHPGGDTRLLRDPISGRCMMVPDADGSWESWEPCEEPAPCSSDSECGEGAHCSTSDGDCGPPPGCDPASGEICPRVCGGVCVADPPATCATDDQCDDGSHCSTRDGMCLPPPGCDDGEVCPAICGGVCVPDVPPPTGCYGDDQCGDGFHCSTRDGDCQPPPGCEMGEACPAVCAGVCVPDGFPGPSSCYSITSEASCIARADCEPLYAGSDCHCVAQGCACDVFTFAQCRPAPSSCDEEMVSSIRGVWASREGTPARNYTFAGVGPDGRGAFRVDDLVSPCPDGAACFWSGIVSNSGTYQPRDDGSYALTYVEPVQRWEGLSLAPAVAIKGCGALRSLIELDTGRSFAAKE